MKYLFSMLFVFLCSFSLYAQEEGLASYYHHKLHGRRTASGELHDKNDLTAAHRTLPFGTYVRVTNLDNNRSVIVEITDRGPRRRKRIIDVSKSAAEALGFVRKGVTRVRIEVVPGPVDLRWLDLIYPEIKLLDFKRNKSSDIEKYEN